MSEPIPAVVAPESSRILSTLNWLRAGVLGANDLAITYGVGNIARTQI
jgi:hypothetical protein